MTQRPMPKWLMSAAWAAIILCALLLIPGCTPAKAHTVWQVGYYCGEHRLSEIQTACLTACEARYAGNAIYVNECKRGVGAYMIGE